LTAYLALTTTDSHRVGIETDPHIRQIKLINGPYLQLAQNKNICQSMHTCTYTSAYKEICYMIHMKCHAKHVAPSCNQSQRMQLLVGNFFTCSSTQRD